ncbi:GNAT family N-acetyltransferase [Ferruginibacter paludis]|uniref:GNAT family N-acetyltransferase n=1 Tax=Ferruginibacter paludis TaxID=1310417 RepID=UPI0025B28C94|nr:GNAT family N-acetyltransferase [Ferruginibacter paludis]MDN3655508.1 GNAT family N-acetyltransferase [Ferruginibacter paludis]
MQQDIQIRKIEKNDNAAIAAIIRSTLKEFGANHPGTVYYDEETDHLFELFQQPLSVYYIASIDGVIAGGGGVYPTKGLPEDTCELVKMYLLPFARGKGVGKMIIDKSIDAARDFGYRKMYLETMPELQQAIKVYEKFGFHYLDGPLGNSVHFGCSKWMLRGL